MTKQPSLLPNDHWVSKGYQKHFADNMHRVAILDTRRGKVITKRPIKGNFCRRGFTTYLDRTGRTNRQLELAFSGIEGYVLNQIRTISPDNCGPDEIAAVANLFAIHMVRNPTFKNMHEKIMREFRANSIPGFAEREDLLARFEAQFERQPNDGEIQQLVFNTYDDFASDPATAVESTARQHDQIAERLNQFYMQLITIAPGLPGFAIGDVPIVHAQTSSGKYGFRDRLAVLDANLIIAPLDRTTAACFTAKPFPTTILDSRQDVDTINAVFIRAALNEVACHPDEAQYLEEVCSQLDQLPIENMLGATARH